MLNKIMVNDDESNFPHKLLSTDTHVSKFLQIVYQLIKN